MTLLLHKLVADPVPVAAVGSGGGGQGALGEGADGVQAVEHGQSLLTTHLDRLHQCTVACSHRLHGVVSILGQHTPLQLTNHLGALTERTHVWCWARSHVRLPSLAHVPVGGTITATHGDHLAGSVLCVSTPEDGTHFNLKLGNNFLGLSPHKHLELPLRLGTKIEHVKVICIYIQNWNVI